MFGARKEGSVRPLHSHSIKPITEYNQHQAAKIADFLTKTAQLNCYCKYEFLLIGLSHVVHNYYKSCYIIVQFMTNQLKKFSTEDVHETVKHKDRGEIICIQVTFAAEVKPTSGKAKLKL